MIFTEKDIRDLKKAKRDREKEKEKRKWIENI